MSLVNHLICYSIGLGVLLWCWYGGKIIYGLICRKRAIYLNSMKLLLNFGVILLLCYDVLIYLSLYVRPPFKMEGSELQSLKKLSDWIISEEIWMGMWLCFAILILGVLAFWFQVKVERIYSVKPIVRITMVNLIIVLCALSLIYFHTYEGLASEIVNHFH